MPPPPPYAADSDSGSDAPEAVSLSAARHGAKTSAARLSSFEAGRREKAKEKNRARAARAQAAAEGRRAAPNRANVAPGEDADELPADNVDGRDDQARLQARMERAMADAGDEDVDDDDDVGDAEDPDADKDEDEAGASEEDGEEEEEPSEDEAASDDNGSVEDGLRDANPDYLPEHLFTAAAAAAASSSSSKAPPSRKRAAPPAARPAKKRRSGAPTRRTDVVAGGRTLRTLATPSAHLPPGATRTVPPPKVAKFADSHLRLGPSSKRAGSRAVARAQAHTPWERRSANLGVLRRSAGPAAHFVRGVEQD